MIWKESNTASTWYWYPYNVMESLHSLVVSWGTYRAAWVNGNDDVALKLCSNQSSSLDEYTTVIVDTVFIRIYIPGMLVSFQMIVFCINLCLNLKSVLIETKNSNCNSYLLSLRSCINYFIKLLGGIKWLLIFFTI